MLAIARQYWFLGFRMIWDYGDYGSVPAEQPSRISLRDDESNETNETIAVSLEPFVAFAVRAVRGHGRCRSAPRTLGGERSGDVVERSGEEPDKPLKEESI